MKTHNYDGIRLKIVMEFSDIHLPITSRLVRVRYIRNPNLVIHVSADDLAPNGAWPSAGTMFTDSSMMTSSNFLRYWPFVRRIHRSPVNSPHKGQWRGALMFSLICTRTNGWVNKDEAGDLRRRRAHCDVIVMQICFLPSLCGYQ